MTTVKLSSKNQIVVPKEAREHLRLKPGDELLVVPKGDAILIMTKPRDVIAALAGTGKHIYRNTDRYLRRERRSWNRRDSGRPSKRTS